MSITNGYATLADMRARLSIDTGDTAMDATIENMVEAVSRAIDHETGRRFYASTETRYYASRNPLELALGTDLLSVTTLSTDDDGDRVYEATWAATDYDLLPANAPLDGWPYTRIAVSPVGTRYFPVTTNPKAVKIVGSWGFCATASLPESVNEACLLAAMQLFKRKDALFGVSGGSGFIQQIKRVMHDDPHIRALLVPYLRRV